MTLLLYVIVKTASLAPLGNWSLISRCYMYCIITIIIRIWRSYTIGNHDIVIAYVISSTNIIILYIKYKYYIYHVQCIKFKYYYINEIISSTNRTTGFIQLEGPVVDIYCYCQPYPMICMVLWIGIVSWCAMCHVCPGVYECKVVYWSTWQCILTTIMFASKLFSAYMYIP